MDVVQFFSFFIKVYCYFYYFVSHSNFCRQTHQVFFGKSDLFFVCMLKPLTFEISKQELEIEDAQVRPGLLGNANNIKNEILYINMSCNRSNQLLIIRRLKLMHI